VASLKLTISGMHCGGCKTKVERALKNVPGSYGAFVDLEGGSAEIDFDGKVPPEKFIEAIRTAGYAAEVA
jgi:copper chaperone CopZ